MESLGRFAETVATIAAKKKPSLSVDHHSFDASSETSIKLV